MLEQRTIGISNHAKTRLKERVVTSGRYLTWQQLVQNARYKGISDNNFIGEFKEWLKTAYRKNNSTQIRIFDKFVYIFSGNNGHARTLITVIPIAEQYSNDYLKYVDK